MDSDLTISQGNLLEDLPALGKEYRMSVEFKASSTSSGGTDNLNSVLHFDKLGPQVFVRNDNKKIRSVGRGQRSDDIFSHG